MCEPVTAMIVASVLTQAAIGGATTGYQIVDSKRTQEHAEDEARKQKTLGAQRIAEGEKKREEEKSAIKAENESADAQKAALLNRDMQRRRKSGMSGTTGRKGGTLLTGPQGLGDMAGGVYKTLLGQ